MFSQKTLNANNFFETENDWKTIMEMNYSLEIRKAPICRRSLLDIAESHIGRCNNFNIAHSTNDYNHFVGCYA